MRVLSNRPAALALIAMLAIPATTGAFAQSQYAIDENIVVTGEAIPDLSTLEAGPEIKGIITARNGERFKVTTPDGASTVLALADATRIRSSGGLFGSSSKTLDANSLFNGLPVTVKTVQWSGGLVASQVTFKNGDLKTAQMIRNGTAQQFEEQTAATEALRGRMGDIDKYNIKSTTNVYFDTGKAKLTPAAQAELCNAAAQADATDNALLLVVGYTDSTGSDEINQPLSERRASAVINYLQQQCRWKPWRMLTPTGMATADPLASNDTIEGRAQNRRVSVNVLVSKAVDTSM